MSKFGASIRTLLIVLTFATITTTALAQTAPTPTPPPTPRPPVQQLAGDLGCWDVFTGDNRVELDTLGGTITYYICVGTRYISAIAVFIFIIVGIMYIIGGFKPDMASTAKTIFGTTVTGLIFMYLISFVINLLAAGGILGKAT